MTRWRLAFAALALCIISSLGAQDADSLLLSFQRNFARSNLGTKLDLLRDSLASEPAALGPLYQQAIDFVLQNGELLRDDPVLLDLAQTASRGAAASNLATSVGSLWRIFMAFRDSPTRVAVLQALATLGKGNGQVVENINQYLANQNNVFRSGMAPDLDTLSACIETLAKLDDGSSFPVLFSSMIAGYPERIGRQAAEALKAIRGDYKKYLIDVMRQNPIREKVAAFNAGVANDAFTPAARGELAEAALEIAMALYPTSEEEKALVNTLRYEAVRELGAQRWTRATSLMLRHFYLVQTDYAKSLATKQQFIEALSALGTLASSEAAQALSLQLGLVNAEMERTKTFDAEIMVALIEALGQLGDKVAFDYLLYIGYLPYPDEIKAVARQALNRLKW